MYFGLKESAKKADEYHVVGLHLLFITSKYQVGKKLYYAFMFVNELYVDKQLAAAHLGFYDEKKIYYYIHMYDEKYVVNGIGKLMLNMLIDEETKGREFDFLRGNEGYKFDYCDESGRVFNFLTYKKGSTYTIMQRTLNALKNNSFVRKIMGR